ncbi:hypothetical protein K501DRAFT_169448 [Backusella circina FSU 941]|nr:hypothetical protein K501DRAFT_169448 [Backusella circina FSU 941]
MSRHAPRAERINIKEEHEVRSAEEEALRAEELDLKIVQDLRSSEEWFEVIPHSHMTESAFKHSLTGTSLRGSHKILRRPLKFFNAKKTKCVLIIHLGDHLSGSHGGVHNGLLATLLDEHLAHVSLPSLPNFTGFTANLNVDYHDIVAPNQWIVLRGELDRVEGRKAFANATIESIDGSTQFASAQSLYISPRKK